MFRRYYFEREFVYTVSYSLFALLGHLVLLCGVRRNTPEVQRCTGNNGAVKLLLGMGQARRIASLGLAIGSLFSCGRALPPGR